MCGIAGYIDFSKRLTNSALEAQERSMAETLNHSGFADRGCWTDEAAGIALAHSRLPILDMIPQGRRARRQEALLQAPVDAT